MAQQKRLGGSFAPPLDSAKLARYKELIAGVDDPKIKDVMQTLHACASKFLETPASREAGSPHPMNGSKVTTNDGRQGTMYAQVVPLESAEVERIWDAVPWDHECDVYGQVLNTLPSGEVRNAAYHLLWYARELTADREPLTADKIEVR